MAESFTFRLEAIRRLRRQERDTQRRVLANAIEHASTTQRHIQILNEQLQGNVSRSRFARHTGPIDVAAMRTNEFHQGWLQQRILESGQMLGERQQEVSQERKNLALANQRLRVLDKLRERQHARFTLDQNRREQTSNDEAALSMYQRSRLLITEREGV